MSVEVLKELGNDGMLVYAVWALIAVVVAIGGFGIRVLYRMLSTMLKWDKDTAVYRTKTDHRLTEVEAQQESLSERVGTVELSVLHKRD